MEEKDPKTYELAFLVKDEEEIPGIVSFLLENKFTIQGEMHPKKIALSYPIKKQKEAVFAYGYFTGLPDDAKLLEKAFKLRPEILRSLIIASPIMPQERTANTDPALRRPTSKPTRSSASNPVAREQREFQPASLSNEALEKKIEEILK